MVTLALTDSQDQQTTAQLPGPGGTARFAVGSPDGERSGVWRLWANKSKADVYVAARVLGHIMKVSLHESGDWRYQFTNTILANKFELGRTGRVIDHWSRPPEIGSGWTRAFSIWVPEEDVVTTASSGVESDKVIWVPKPTQGTAVGFHVVVARPDLGVVQLRGFVLLDAFSLVNGEVCLLLASLRTITPNLQQQLDEIRARAMFLASQVDLSTVASPRMALWGTDNNDHRFLFDLVARKGGP